MQEKELEIIKQLRQNARETLTRMSRKTGIPVSTIYERLKNFERTIINKHTCLIDFKRLGYDLRITLLVTAKPGCKEEVENYLCGHHQVNTLLRINNGYDFLAEALFTNMSSLQVFLDELDKQQVKNRKEYYVLEEIQRETFLTTDTHIQLLEPMLVIQ